MSNHPDQRRITRLAFKDEGENTEGMVIGPLTDQDGVSVFPDSRYVTKQEALRIARDLRVDLVDS
jgi:hypothetical protein